MAIVINGSGTITGISTGGLPDGIVDDGTLATSAVTSTKILDGTILNADINASAAIAGSKVDGSFGKVLQVVHNIGPSSQISGTSTHGLAVSGTITPSSTTSKIFIMANSAVAAVFNSNAAVEHAVRYDGSELATTIVSRTGYSVRQSGANPEYFCLSSVGLHSPSTTSAITYSVYTGKTSGNTTSWYVDPDRVSLVLMEVSS